MRHMRSLFSGLFGFATIAALTVAPAQAQSINTTFTLGSATGSGTSPLSYSGSSTTLTLTNGVFQDVVIGSYTGTTGSTGSGNITSLLTVTGVSGSTSIPGTYSSSYFSPGGNQFITTYSVPSSSAITLNLTGGGTISFQLRGGGQGTSGAPGSPVVFNSNYRITYNAAAATEAPEPGSLALLGMAGLPMVGMVIRRRKAA